MIERSPNYKKYFELQSNNLDLMLIRLKLIGRNVIYAGYKKGVRINDLQHFRDLFRDKTKPSLMAVINFCDAFEVNIHDITHRDLLTEDISSGCLTPGFNPETYRLPSDIW